MRNKLIAIGVIVVLIGAAVAFGMRNADDTRKGNDGANSETIAEAREGMQTISLEGTGISFTYKAGADGYRLIEPALDQYGEPALVKAYVLMPERDYKLIENGTFAGGEAPPTMTIFVLSNPDNTETLEWARAHNLFTNIELAMGEPERATVGGVEGLHYRADGLYAMDTYLVSQNGKMYVISGSFIATGTPITADFAALRESIEFN